MFVLFELVQLNQRHRRTVSQFKMTQPVIISAVCCVLQGGVAEAGSQEDGDS